jgi:hypothetical protein
MTCLTADRLKLRLITGVLFLVKFIYKRTKVRVPEAFTLPLRKRVKFIKGKAEVNITIS